VNSWKTTVVLGKLTNWTTTEASNWDKTICWCYTYKKELPNTSDTRKIQSVMISAEKKTATSRLFIYLKHDSKTKHNINCSTLTVIPS